MEQIAKYIFLGLLTLPFVALITDALGKTKGMMLPVVCGVTAISALLAYSIGGVGQRPNIANIASWAFITWPVLLLIAKGFNPTLSWRSLWISVPIMSWYLVNLTMFFYYPISGCGGGLASGLGLVAGWLYMVIPFAPMSAVFLGIQYLVKRIKGVQNAVANP
jgi:hypothetical protein